MKSKIFKIKILVGLGILFATMNLASCKKFVDNGTPPNAIGEDGAFADSSTATSAVLGIYSGTANGTGSIVFNSLKYGAMSADEGYYLLNTAFDNFKNNTLAAGNDANVYWQSIYTKIGVANYAIAGITQSPTLSSSVKNQLLGEAKFWRAWYYFHLVNYFGDVPLVTTTDALNTGILPRTPVVQVNQQIVTDLTDAKGLLTAVYPSIEKARINKNVASAFLARVYFYQQNWPAAEAEASNVIGSGVYSIVTNLNNVFVSNSSETIWQISLAAATTPQTIMGAEFIPAATTPTFVLYDTLANTFEANDQRKVNWTKSITYLSKTYYYPYKYKVRSTTAGNEYPIMLRLSEMYLIRAEARANQNNITTGVDDLNVVRQRAGVTALPTTLTQAELLTALQHERWVELFTESGDRWFNLKRLNKATATLSPIKPLWQAFQQLYPLPAQEMNANKNLVQNPGY